MSENLREIVERMKEIQVEMLDLIEELTTLVFSIEDKYTSARAKATWIANITVALTTEHKYAMRMYSLEDTILDIESSQQYEEEGDQL